MPVDKLRVLITRERIAAKVAEMGQRISQDFAGEPVVLIGVLKGATIFLTDLARQITLDVSFDFIAVSSYGNAWGAPSFRFFCERMGMRNRAHRNCHCVGAHPQSSNHGHFAVLLTRGPYGNLHVLPEGGEKIHQPFDGESARAVAHQGGDVRLLDAQDPSGFGLPEAAAFDKTVNLQGELGFQQLLLGMGKTEVSKNISAAFFPLDGLLRSRRHVSSASLCVAVPPQPAGDG